MKRLLAAAIALVAILAAWLWPRHASDSPPNSGITAAALTPAANTKQPNSEAATNASPTSTKPALLPGEIILKDFGDPTRPPAHDLTLIAQVLENYGLLIKAASMRTLSSNEEWAAALRGTNPAHIRFLPDQHPAFNAEGQLVDRWDTPLFFHPLGGNHYEIRSAGPDRKLWTEDDIQRNPDGSFYTGPHLREQALPPSR